MIWGSSLYLAQLSTWPRCVDHEDIDRACRLSLQSVFAGFLHRLVMIDLEDKASNRCEIYAEAQILENYAAA